MAFKTEETYENVKFTISKEITRLAYEFLRPAGCGYDESKPLIRDLRFFCIGYDASETEEDEFIDIPEEWQKYFLLEDPEYQEYLRLSEKFKDVK